MIVWIATLVVVGMASAWCVDRTLLTRRVHSLMDRLAVLDEGIVPDGRGPSLDERGTRTRRRRQVANAAARTIAVAPGRLRDGGVRLLLSASVEDLAQLVAEIRTELVGISDPDGSLTIFFSDIEDSTAINQALGDHRWVEVLGTHDRLVRSVVLRHAGRVVKAQGDGYMAVFTDPSEATRAALAIQEASRSLRGGPEQGLRVRIGLHVGDAISHDGDYFGITVATAARIANQALGDEILVSSAMADRLALATGIILENRGRHELRGLAGVHQLWAATRSPTASEWKKRSRPPTLMSRNPRSHAREPRRGSSSY
jgi:adenylate cyclase